METDRDFRRGSMPTLILSVLRSGPLHGYAIAREIERRSGQTLKCREGTLYPILHTLEGEQFIVGEWRTESGDRPRKVYVLTSAGLAALERQKDRWAQFVSAIDRVLEGNPDAGTDSAHTCPEPA